MKYVNDLEIGKKVIIDKYPEFANSAFEGDNSGWDNYVVKVDNKYIFRFSRDGGAYRVIKMEFDVLSKLKLKLPKNIKVPDFIYYNLDSDYPFVGYEMIQGKFLSKELFYEMEGEKKEQFLENMAEFINILHSLDVKSCELDIIDPVENYKMRYKEFKDKAYKYFNEEIRNKTDLLFESYFNNKNMYKYIPTVIHGDLSTDHIIITDDGIGIIDFGDTRIYDGAYDFQWAYLLGKDIFEKILKKYNKQIDDYFIDRIANFYTKIIPYYGVVYASEINDNELLEKSIKEIKLLK